MSPSSGNLQRVRYRTAPFISLLNFLLFCIFMGCLWAYSSLDKIANMQFGQTEISMLMLQSVSLLLLVGALQMTTKKDKFWRILLVSLSFIALSESSMVALLSPV